MLPGASASAPDSAVPAGLSLSPEGHSLHQQGKWWVAATLIIITLQSPLLCLVPPEDRCEATFRLSCENGERATGRLEGDEEAPVAPRTALLAPDHPIPEPQTSLPLRS